MWELLRSCQAPGTGPAMFVVIIFKKWKPLNYFRVKDQDLNGISGISCCRSEVPFGTWDLSHVLLFSPGHYITEGKKNTLSTGFVYIIPLPPPNKLVSRSYKAWLSLTLALAVTIILLFHDLSSLNKLCIFYSPWIRHLSFREDVCS